VPGEHELAETRREALDLRLDRSVMSCPEPFGTWQYAQAVCLPAGARVGSKRLV
jgi:hypothetical protein